MSETATVALLPGEGETRTQVRVRRCCEQCGEPATVRLGFLLENYRTNPASNAYGRDDCSWVTDFDAYVCGEEDCRLAAMRGPRTKGYADGCSSWTLNDRFAHLFLTWEVQS